MKFYVGKTWPEEQVISSWVRSGSYSRYHKILNFHNFLPYGGDLCSVNAIWFFLRNLIKTLTFMRQLVTLLAYSKVHRQVV